MLKIIHAQLKDLPKIVAIYNQSIPSRLATADLEEITVASREAWFHAHQPDTRPLWIIQEAEEIIGWLSLSDFYGRPAYQQTAEISIYLADTCQGKGIGQAALTFVESQLSQLNVTTLLAFVFAHNTSSIHLFEKNGFTTWGLLPEVALMDQDRRDLQILGKKYSS
ncbi:L-amino acid N-acyltransferase YncA [Enterococcus sp. PF1-24]|uniref:GNAT family N-acetyltransferase n=1 Tax=unclassified Enterococcus TaxID=2608891 RepID=UPI0024756B76|nr:MULTISPECIES: GNAT family N-acetyltransferase [unclassified Enterococcus]MDH6365398.1 L-amino acid N-acyltransferase YncA [Enterococcus sp. PFB1-1]MDH6402499.1 L-amino acid N-acyltransferase YncA [Enterococcus sp. PF1-24]